MIATEAAGQRRMNNKKNKIIATEDGTPVVAAKRPRSEGAAVSLTQDEASTDFFHLAVGNMHEDCGALGTAPTLPPVISSWLSQPTWLTAASEEMVCDDNHDHELLCSEIDSLSKQLIQVKRRLEPAAQLCAESSGTHSRAEFVKARSRCNPMEALAERRGLLGKLFLNRAAMKLANMDALLHFDLTQKQQQNSSRDDPFVFVDLCGAPGGFSEYMVKRCSRNNINNHHNTAVYGYGMSLQGSNEHGQGTPWRFNSSSFRRQHKCLKQYRICKGVDGSGDIFNWDNVESLQALLMRDRNQLWSTGAESLNHSESLDSAEKMSFDTTDAEQDEPLTAIPAKAQLVLADGGSDAQRDSEHQEALSQKLLVCQVAAALSMLAEGGTLLIKMFGFQTSVTRAVLHDLHQHFFASLIALKPVCSRPASAERYLVCRGFLGVRNHPRWKDGPAWRNAMFLGGSHSSMDAAASRYWNTFDRDLLRLNLKACFAVLTHLESKQQQHRYHEDDDNPARLLNLAAYKEAWQLQQL